MMNTHEILNLVTEQARSIDAPLYAVTVIFDGVSETAEIRLGNRVNALYSVTKGFVSTAIGWACDRGLLTTETTVYDLFADAYPDLCGDAWKACTVAHVLSQTTGIEHGFLDADSDDVQSFGEDWMIPVLSHAPVHTPGAHFCYSDSNFYLLSRIFARVTGEPIGAFWERELFRPMGFSLHASAVCPLGHSPGGTGLFLCCEDMAKLGQLYLQGGIWQGKRILSEDWCRRATAMHVRISDTDGYAYGFRKYTHAPPDEFFISGSKNQGVHVYPENNLVIAWQGHDRQNNRLGPFLEYVNTLGRSPL